MTRIEKKQRVGCLSFTQRVEQSRRKKPAREVIHISRLSLCEERSVRQDGAEAMAKRCSEGCACVWLGKRLTKNDEDRLRSSIASLHMFDDCDHCVDFITEISDEPFFLVIAHPLFSSIVPLVQHIKQIQAMYLYCPAGDQRLLPTNKTSGKVRGPFFDSGSLCTRLEEDRDQYERDAVGISYVSRDETDTKQKKTKQQDPTFMYSQLLKEILLHDLAEENEEDSRREMIHLCRRRYEGNACELRYVEEFEREYSRDKAIHWYTRECFLFKLLNRALWTSEEDVLYQMRYFLRHLHQQIVSEGERQAARRSTSIVYRGQTMSADQLNEIKSNVGGLLSFNNFLSTSLDAAVAQRFLAESNSSVLFHIRMDPMGSSCHYVNVEQFSALQGEQCEREILFSMGTVFRIERIERGEHFHRVYLNLTDEVDEQLSVYTRLAREQVRSSHSFLSLLRLINQLGQWNRIDRFARLLRENFSLQTNPSILGSIQHALGDIYHSKGQYQISLSHYQQALDIYLDSLPANHPRLSPTYNNMGCAYLSLQDDHMALLYQQLALDCQLKSANPDLDSIVAYTGNLASIYSNQEKYDEALRHYQRALQLQIEYLGEDHPSLIGTYTKMRSICLKQSDWVQASE